MIGFDQNSVSVLTTSSGMAAYSLIEKYLIRDILEQNDIIYSPRYDYGELQNIKFCGKLFSIVQHENDNHDEIINYILNCCPKVVFLSSIYNIPGTPVLDILFILEKIYNSEYQKDIHIIIDDSLVTGAINPFIFQTDFINIYYFSSAIKYLQAGMDSGFAGILAVNKSKFDCFRKLRGMTGLGLYDNSAWLYPLQTFEIYQARMRRLTRNALLVAEKLQENEEFYKHWDVQYPLLQNHPDYHSAKKLPFIGSLVTLVPRSAPLFANFENVQPLFKLIDRILRSAHEEGISIIRSESFGFSDVRINAYGWYNRKPPYIRLSCGDRCYEEIHHIVTKLSEIIIPGTHDAATWKGMINVDAIKQSLLFVNVMII